MPNGAVPQNTYLPTVYKMSRTPPSKKVNIVKIAM